MHTQDISQNAAKLLTDIGGEPLTESGFETEVPEAEFAAGELSATDRTGETGE